MKASTIQDFHNAQATADRAICDALRTVIDEMLPDAESKIWHAHPVWFLEENPIVGYNKLKSCIRLMFWSGAGFDEPKLESGSGKLMDASIRYTDVEEIGYDDLRRWLAMSRQVQWDYRNIYKRKGRLERLA